MQRYKSKRQKLDGMDWPFRSRTVNRTNDDLVDRIAQQEIWNVTRPSLPVTDARVIAAMRRVDRRKFIPEEATVWPAEEYHLFGADVPNEEIEVPAKACAYADLPVPIGKQMTCSQPSLVAYMIQLLEVEPGMKVLEIGSGCGYAAAILGELGAQVVGVERILSVLCLGQENISAQFRERWPKPVSLLWWNGFHGFPSEAPYDRVLISAQPPDGPDEFNSGVLAEQLREHTGMIVFPKDSLVQHRYDRGTLVERKYEPQICFVPLVGQGRE